MSTVVSLLLSVVGVIVLAKASDRFVDGAVALSNRFQVSPVLIGAVVIGLGTSVPELIVSSLAAARGDAAIGVGNIVGSNVANLSLVLGSAAVLAPMAVSRRVVHREAPLSFAAVALFGFLLRDGLTMADAVVLLLALVIVMGTILVTSSRQESEELAEEIVGEGIAELRHAPTRHIGLVTLLGLVGTALGAQILITGATGVAEDLGLSQGFVGVTLVAVGTSLPELVTAVQAARRGAEELILGNVLGSNIFNSLAVGGALALFAPGHIGEPQLTGAGTAIMVAVSLAAWLVMWGTRRIVRLEGFALLAGYAVFVAFLT